VHGKHWATSPAFWYSFSVHHALPYTFYFLYPVSKEHILKFFLDFIFPSTAPRKGKASISSYWSASSDEFKNCNCSKSAYRFFFQVEKQLCSCGILDF
jgi:hypothetical protein